MHLLDSRRIVRGNYDVNVANLIHVTTVSSAETYALTTHLFSDFERIDDIYTVSACADTDEHITFVGQ
jgi:hypothetical protein